MGGEYFYPEYIAEGYRESAIEVDDQIKLIYFENEKGDRIEFLQTELGGDLQVDTEDGSTEEINVNAWEGLLVRKDEMKTLVWFTDTNTFYLRGSLDEEEMLSMAESIKLLK